MAQGLGSSSEKQVRFALSLLEKANYPTHRVVTKHSNLAPVTDRDIGTSVERWLHSMSGQTIARLIDTLKKELE